MRTKITALASLILGTSLLIYTWAPIVKWYLLVRPNLIKKSTIFLSPMAEINQNSVFGKVATPQTTNFGELNFQEKKNQFFLTIERFGITRAKVVTGDDFLSNLAHLPKSGLPGKVGNVVVSGHSALPQLFSPDEYWSIFSKLYLLEAGDRIILEVGDRNYVYLVSEMLVVKPSDTWVIAPPDLYGAYLTLLTCGVGGLSQDRIIVRATLANSQELT